MRNLREDIINIWQSGVKGVLPAFLIEENVFIDTASNQRLKFRSASTLHVGDNSFPLNGIGKVVVIGAGKASGKMSQSLERILLPHLGKKRILGWVNVPDDCVCESGGVTPLTEVIHLHGARPAGVNEPTEAGVFGVRQIINLVGSLKPHDLCICLLSGGGSALLPAPIPQITLKDKLEITRALSSAGANIDELNTVRKQLSTLKGGGLLGLCQGKQLISLILSDVLGDPLDVIASGPTVENTTSAYDAIIVLDKFRKRCDAELFARIRRVLVDKTVNDTSKINLSASCEKTEAAENKIIIIGNNAVAVDSAGIEAEKRGYSHAMVSERECEGAAEDVGKHLAEIAFSMLESGPDCLISGGEPTVTLPPAALRGKGGRNQQLVLAMLVVFLRKLFFYEEKIVEISGAVNFNVDAIPKIAVLSGGTDGEDGPTDAAGAFFDAGILLRAAELWQSGELDPLDYLQRCDAYNYFQRIGGLLKSGPTGTNVCDLRVIAVER
ncbi:MAG: glycerate kinase type-2 family protein [Thermoguttaceae bacterium]